MAVEQYRVRKTCQSRLTPTLTQEQALETVVLRCRALYNCAVEQRRTWWGRGQGIGATYYQRALELPYLKAAGPEYGPRICEVPFAGLARCLAPGGQDPSGVLPPSRRWGNAGVSSVPGPVPLALLHLSTIWQRCRAGRRGAQPVQDRLDSGAPASPAVRAGPRPSPSVGKQTAGMPVSRVQTCRRSRCHKPERRPAST
jgi:hypothetical protein